MTKCICDICKVNEVGKFKGYIITVFVDRETKYNNKEITISRIKTI